MLIAQITDTHLCLPEPAGSHRADDLARVVAALNHLDPEPDLIVHTGDIVHNGTVEEYDWARELLAPLGAPLWCIPGNKDRRGPMVRAFGDNVGECPPEGHISYRLETPEVDLIFADTLADGENKGAFDKLRRMRLGQMLDDAAGRPAIIFMHHPPIEVRGAPDPNQYLDPSDLGRLEHVLARRPNVAAIICGHGHRSQQRPFAGINSFMLTCLAVDLRKPKAEAEAKPPPVFALHNASAGKVTSEIRSA